jgi:oxidoreductase
MRAVVLGATGATGSHLTATLLQRESVWSSVVVVARRRLEELPSEYALDVHALERAGRLVQRVGDFAALIMDHTVFSGADTVFCTVGSTRKQAGSASNFRQVDLEYVASSAASAKTAGVPHFALLTSQGANAGALNSDSILCHGLLYMHVKGAAEEAVKSQAFQRTTIYRPGMLDRGGHDARSWAEGLIVKLLPSTHVRTVARAMVARAEDAGQSSLLGQELTAHVEMLDTAEIRAAAEALR